MRQDFVQADRVSVIVFQFAENNGGKNGPSPQDEEHLVNSVNHFRRAGVKVVGNEERRGKGRRRHPETDRHLLHRARNGAGAARLEKLAQMLMKMRAPPLSWSQ